MADTTGEPVLVFHDLGALVVERGDGRLPIAGRRLEGAVCLLLVQLNRRVSGDALEQALWPGDVVPEGRSGSRQTLIWRLRQLLEPDRKRPEAYRVVASDALGYRLVLEPKQVDSQRFVEAAADARDLALRGEPAPALQRCDDALAMWRGPPFTPFTDEEWALAAVARLEETRRQVIERRVDCLIGLGDPGTALVSLDNDLAEFPLSERLWAARMLASYQLGRVEQALQAFQAARQILLDEVGVEPGVELRELQARVLAGDPALLGPLRSPPGPVPVVPALGVLHAPRRRSGLIGRSVELERLKAALMEHSLVTLLGTGGVGKTSLALEAARAVESEFRDGICFVDLAAAQDASQVSDAVTSTLGITALSPGAGQYALATFLGARQMLIILDNCEHVLQESAELADSVLSAAPGPVILATSREPLAVAGEFVCAIAPLPVPHMDESETVVAGLERLARQPAVRLFVERYRSAAPEVDLDELDLRSVARICAALDGLPLAIELAAGQGQAFSLAEIEERVRADAGDLSSVGGRRRGHHRSLKDALDWSFVTLSEDEARVHERLSAVPGPLTADVAMALSPDLTRPAVQDALSGLVYRSMLVPSAPLRRSAPSRFNQLATIRAHARSLSLDHHDADERADRRDRWVMRLIDDRPRLGHPDEVTWHGRLDDDLAAVRATLQHSLAEQPTPDGAVIASRLDLYWYYRGMSVEGQRWLELAMRQERLLNRFEQCLVRFALAESYARGGRMPAALELLERLEPFDLAQLSLEQLVVVAEGAATFVSSAFIAADAAVCARYAHVVAMLAERAGDPDLTLLADIAMLQADSLTGDPATALVRAAALWKRAVVGPNLYVTRTAAGQATVAALRLRQPEVGVVWATRVLQQHRDLGLSQAPMLMEVCADLLAMSGRPTEAVRLFSAAQAQSRKAGLRWPQHAFSAVLLERATASLSDVELRHAQDDGTRTTLGDLEEVMGRVASLSYAGRR